MDINFKVDDIVYDKQARWFDFDYHPQRITKVNENDIEVFEEGYPPNGKAFTVPKTNFSIIH